jgi:hypothetical protein
LHSRPAHPQGRARPVHSPAPGRQPCLPGSPSTRARRVSRPLSPSLPLSLSLSLARAAWHPPRRPRHGSPAAKPRRQARLVRGSRRGAAQPVGACRGAPVAACRCRGAAARSPQDLGPAGRETLQGHLAEARGQWGSAGRQQAVSRRSRDTGCVTRGQLAETAIRFTGRDTGSVGSVLKACESEMRRRRAVNDDG